MDMVEFANDLLRLHGELLTTPRSICKHWFEEDGEYCKAERAVTGCGASREECWYGHFTERGC